MMKSVRKPKPIGYGCWSDMKSRCYNKNNKSYSRYGGRGITVCARWRSSYHAFMSDMGPRPSDRHSLDRINNDGNYEPKNCRWTTYSVQNRNRGKKRNKLNIPYRGVNAVFYKGFFTGRYQVTVREHGKTLYLGSSFSAVCAALIFDNYQIEKNRLEGLNLKVVRTAA